MELLRKIYEEGVNTREKRVPDSEAYRKKLHDISASLGNFVRTLDPGQKRLFNRIINLNHEVRELESFTDFKYGFSAAMTLNAEVMSAKRENE